MFTKNIVKKLSKRALARELELQGFELMLLSHTQSWNKEQTCSWSFILLSKQEYESHVISDFEYHTSYRGDDVKDLTKGDYLDLLDKKIITFYCDTFGDMADVVRR